MEFWERLRELRAGKDETQLQTAQNIGITHRQYQGLEAGSSLPSYKNLLAIADYFDVSLDYLMGRSDVRERR